MEGVPDLPVAPQDEAGLTTTFQTWPRGWFHIPKDPDFLLLLALLFLAPTLTGEKNSHIFLCGNFILQTHLRASHYTAQESAET